MRWSPKPKEDYGIDYKGHRVGIGHNPVFNGRPGLWNLFWLVSRKVDACLDWEDAPEKIPVSSKLLEACIDSAPIVVGNQTVETAAESMGPYDFITWLEVKEPELPCIKFFNGQAFSVMEERAAQYVGVVEKKGNILYAKFGKG